MRELTYTIGGDVLALVIIPVEDEQLFTRWLARSGYQYNEVVCRTIPQFSMKAGEAIINEYLNHLEQEDAKLQTRPV